MIDSLKQKAAEAWLRKGESLASLENMATDELEALANLTDEHGQPVANFNEHFAAFQREYYDRRKATVDDFTPETQE